MTVPRPLQHPATAATPRPANRYPDMTVRAGGQRWSPGGSTTRRPPQSPPALRRVRRPSTDPPHLEETVTGTQEQAPGADVPQRDIDGTRCTTRAGIATLAGWKPGNSVNVRAGTDPDFPPPLTKIGRDFWYPLEGENGVDAYLRILAERAVAKKPPPVEPGDPDDLLNVEQAAKAMHLTPASFRSYIRWSIPYWDGARTGTPLLPKPDEVDEAPARRGIGPDRRWYRRTLAEHQKRRPGMGANAGRPAKAQTPPS